MIGLCEQTFDKDEEGNIVQSGDSEKTVYCNQRKVSNTSRIAASSSKLSADAEVEVRSSDYASEQECVFNGKRYNVSNVSDSGEFTVLTLSERLEDGQ